MDFTIDFKIIHDVMFAIRGVTADVTAIRAEPRGSAAISIFLLIKIFFYVRADARAIRAARMRAVPRPRSPLWFAIIKCVFLFQLITFFFLLVGVIIFL